MACGACGKRKAAKRALVDDSPVSRIVFYAVDPTGRGVPYRNLVEARVSARKGGLGWTVDGRREVIVPEVVV